MKKILIALLALMALIVFSACAPTSDNEAETDTASETQQTDTSSETQQTDGEAEQTTELETVTFVLDWTPNTNHTGVYVAVENGYFAENGLEVEIVQPAENSVIQLVAAGTAQFGINFQESLTFARDEGIPVVSIAAILQHNTSAFASPVDRGIESAKDFEGKIYAGWGMDMETATLKYLMEQDGGDFSKLEITTIGDTDFLTAAEMGMVDFAWIYEGWDGIRAELEGIDLNYVYLSDSVFDYYTPIMITSEDMIENNSDTVAAFMDAVKKGYEFAVENPEESAAILLKYAPELDEELVYASQEYLSTKYIDDAESFGIQEKEVWDRYTQWLYDQGFIETLVDSDSAFTNEFVE